MQNDYVLKCNKKNNVMTLKYVFGIGNYLPFFVHMNVINEKYKPSLSLSVQRYLLMSIIREAK